MQIDQAVPNIHQEPRVFFESKRRVKNHGPVKLDESVSKFVFQVADTHIVILELDGLDYETVIASRMRVEGFVTALCMMGWSCLMSRVGCEVEV